MTDAVATKNDLPVLHATTEAISTALKPMLSVDTKTGTITASQGAYEQLLTTNTSLTVAQVTELQTFNTHFIAGALDATGTVSCEAAAKATDLKETNVEIPMVGKDRLDATWTKSVERNAGIPKKGEEPVKKTVYGTMQAKLTVAGTDIGVGELSKVAKRQKAAAMELFAQ